VNGNEIRDEKATVPLDGKARRVGQYQAVSQETGLEKRVFATLPKGRRRRHES